MGTITIIIALLFLSAFIAGMTYDYLDKALEKKFGKKRYADMSTIMSILYTFVPGLLFIDYVMVMFIGGMLHDMRMKKLLDTDDRITITSAKCSDELEMDQFGKMQNIKKCYLTYRYINSELHNIHGKQETVLVGDICDNFKNVTSSINTTATELRLLELNKNMEALSAKHNNIIGNVMEDSPKALENFSNTLDFTISKEKEKINVK